MDSKVLFLSLGLNDALERICYRVIRPHAWQNCDTVKWFLARFTGVDTLRAWTDRDKIVKFFAVTKDNIVIIESHRLF